MVVKELTVYKTDKSKRGTLITASFEIVNSNEVNGRVQIRTDSGTIYWANSSDIDKCRVNERTVIEHTVKWGENIDQICRMYGADYNQLYAQYPNKLAAGMKIHIVK